MKVIDAAAWAAEIHEQEENGVYDSLVTDTVKKWADALEAEMDSGKRLSAIALPTLMETDDTISGGGVYECTRLLQKHSGTGIRRTAAEMARRVLGTQERDRDPLHLLDEANLIVR